MAMIKLLGLIFCLLISVFAQSSKNEAKPTAAITGRVTIGSQPAANVTIVLFSNRSGNRVAIAKAITDANGYYRLTNLAAGSYRVAPLAPGYITENSNGMYETGKLVNLDDGDAVEDIDFSLQRGGAITGRITDANHQPLIEEIINIMQIDEKRQQQYEPPMPFNPRNMLTDDRGVYRLYGLAPGKYKVYVGVNESSANIYSGSRRLRRITYYPNTTDADKAEIIEVTEGGEVANIDITLGEAVKTYQASGRIIDAETGKPLSGIRYDCGVVYEGNHFFFGRGGGELANAKGEFRVTGILPGRYAVFISNEKPEEFYSEPAVFEIKDADVSNLEVKVRRGVSLSGIVIVEGAGDVNLSSLLPTVSIQTVAEDGLYAAPSYYDENVAANGSFKILGLPPGLKRIYISARDRQLILLRVEHNGADVTKGFMVKAGEPLTGLRVVLGYGAGTIRGEVKLENGTLPENARQVIHIRMKSNEAIGFTSKSVDSRGRFVFDSLPPGEYELSFYLMIESTLQKQLNKTVSVSNGATTQVNFVVDLQAKEPDR